jgi:glutaredoxin-like protein NrdH
MHTTLTLYTLPTCMQCTLTKRALDNAGLPYNVIDLSQDDIAAEYVRSLGHTTAPVVTIGDTHWSGFRPDLITAIATARGNTTGSQPATTGVPGKGWS